MRIRIPLPWYSKEAYDVTMDEWRGGWRFIGISIQFDRAYCHGIAAGFHMRFSIGIGTRFPPLAHLVVHKWR